MEDEYNTLDNLDDDFYEQDIYDEEYEYDYNDDNYNYEDYDEYLDKSLEENAKIPENEYEEYEEYDDYYEYEDYDEEKNENTFGLIIRKLIKYFIIFLILIFIIWLIFIFIKPKANNNKVKDDDVKVIKKNNSNYEEMFLKMKNATLNYYNEDNLEDENTLSLEQMKDANLIDNIASSYNLEKSYAKVTKNDSDYKLEIHVVDNEKEYSKSYILGKYIYCNDTYLCEKDSSLEKELYEYEKANSPILSNWSAWTNYEQTSCDTNKITCDDNDINCLTEVKISSKNITTGKENKVYKTSRSAFKTIEKEVKQVCGNYDYIKINGVYYRTEKDSNFKLLGAIKKDTRSNYYNFRYNGRNSYHTPPNDTINTRYVFVDADYSNCSNTCSDHPNYYYDSYTFTKSLVPVTNPLLDCNNHITKVIPNYLIEPQQITVSRDEVKQELVCYKSSRTRTKENQENTIKWSNYDDRELLDNGYSYTGNRKEK